MSGSVGGGRPRAQLELWNRQGFGYGELGKRKVLEDLSLGAQSLQGRHRVELSLEA